MDPTTDSIVFTFAIVGMFAAIMAVGAVILWLVVLIVSGICYIRDKPAMKEVDRLRSMHYFMESRLDKLERANKEEIEE